VPEAEGTLGAVGTLDAVAVDSVELLTLGLAEAADGTALKAADAVPGAGAEGAALWIVEAPNPEEEGATEALSAGLADVTLAVAVPRALGPGPPGTAAVGAAVFAPPDGSPSASSGSREPLLQPARKSAVARRVVCRWVNGCWVARKTERAQPSSMPSAPSPSCCRTEPRVDAS
jgi:hypothetical protein